MSKFFILGSEGKPHQLLIYDVIGLSYWTEGVTAKEIVLALAQIGADDEIHVRINTRGGSHDDGIAIYNALANHTGKVVIKVEGYAASMGSVIACASDDVQVYETALFMLHRASTYCYGNTNDMLEAAEALKAADNSLATAYARKTGKKADEILVFLDEKRDTWLTPEEAKTFGIVDQIIVPAKFIALLDKSAITALAENEGAAILENVPLPPKIKAALEGMKGALALRIDATGIEAIKAQADDPEPPEGDDTPDDDVPVDDEIKADPVPPVDPVADERARVSAIMAQAKASGIDDDDLIQGFIKDGTSAALAGKSMLAIKRATQNTQAIHSRENPPPNPSGGSDIQASWANAYQPKKGR